MKINSNTFQFDRSSYSYREIESILTRVAEKNNIDDVSEIALSLNPNSGVVQFKTAADVDYNGVTEDLNNNQAFDEQNNQNEPEFGFSIVSEQNQDTQGNPLLGGMPTVSQTPNNKQTPLFSNSDIQSGVEKGMNTLLGKNKEPANAGNPMPPAQTHSNQNTQNTQSGQTVKPEENEEGSAGNEDESKSKDEGMGSPTQEKEPPKPVSEDEAKKMMEKMQKEYAEKQKQNQEQGPPDWLNELKEMPVKKPAQ